MPEARGGGCEARVLVTGADGYLGGRIARHWLETTDDGLMLWVRGAKGSPRPERRAAAVGAVAGSERRVEIHGGDLLEAMPLASIDPRRVEVIVHAAAVTRFTVDAGTATAVNVRGTSKVLAFARLCPRLRSFVYVSTVYASGLRGGAIAEAPCAQAPFANEYERSKNAAEALVVAAADLPWRILRVATVIADDGEGRVVQHNAFHNTLSLLFHGLLSTLPGRPDTPVYFVTADLVADAACRLARNGGPRTLWHACPRREESLTLGRLIDTVLDVFGSEASFRRRRAPRPLFMDEQAFAMLREAVTAFAGPLVREAVQSVAPFAAQLYVDKDVLNEAFRAAVPLRALPDAETLVRRTCAFLLRTRWGRQVSHVAS